MRNIENLSLMFNVLCEILCDHSYLVFTLTYFVVSQRKKKKRERKRNRNDRMLGIEKCLSSQMADRDTSRCFNSKFRSGSLYNIDQIATVICVLLEYVLYMLCITYQHFKVPLGVTYCNKDKK